MGLMKFFSWKIINNTMLHALYSVIIIFLWYYSILESADGAILLFDVTNKQSFVNLVSDKDNSREIKRSWMKELIFKAKDDKYPVMILGMQLHTYGMPSLSASKTLLIAV